MGDQGLGTQPWLAWNVLCSFTRLCPPEYEDRRRAPPHLAVSVCPASPPSGGMG